MSINVGIPRPEHPNPQCRRKIWQNLNGKWEFEIDNAVSGFDRKFFERDSLNGEIIVPFCPESKLSGVENKDFMNCVWYRRKFSVSESWLENNRHIFLHIGACDYKTHVYINGKNVGVHYGGYSSFEFEITKYLTEENNVLTIAACDDTRTPLQGTGKQSIDYYSKRCH